MSETSIAQTVRITDDKARYDAACKRVLSEKTILAWIMQNCLEEYRSCTITEIAEKYIEGQPEIGTVPVHQDDKGSVINGMPNEDASIEEGSVFFDIRFWAIIPNTDDYARLIINLESQNNWNPGYPLLKRGIYYCSRLLSAQRGREFNHSDYDKLKKVYSIWICAEPPKNRENTINRYRMVEESLVGDAKEKTENYDLLSIIMICLGNSDSENHQGLLKMLEVLLSSTRTVTEKKEILQDEFAIPMSVDLEKEVTDMCNLSQGIEDRAMAKGMAKGMAEGMTKGMAEGMTKGMAEGMTKGMAEGVTKGVAEALKNLIETTKLPADKAMDMLKIPEAEREKYAKLLN